MVGEMDGVRILGSRSHELLHEVPLVCQDIFKIASMAPGALLLEAHREYEVRSSPAPPGRRGGGRRVRPQLMSLGTEIESEGGRVPEGAEGAEHAGGGGGTVCGGCTARVRPPDPEVSAAGEPSPLSAAAAAVVPALAVVLQPCRLSPRRRRSESAFWLTSAPSRLWRPAESCEC